MFSSENITSVMCDGNTVFVWRINITTREKIIEFIKTIIRSHDRVIIDLSNIILIDSEGIQMIIATQSLVCRSGKKLTLRCKNWLGEKISKLFTSSQSMDIEVVSSDAKVPALV